MSSTVSFYLNGRAVTIENPAPDLLLIDYLRSPDVALAGPKKPCGEGGCGGCTVILSRWNDAENKPEHRAINACLRPVCALSGLVVTTVEGTGAVRTPDAKHLLHTHTASRSAAPIGKHHSPVFVAAKKAAANKRRAVLAAVRAQLADKNAATQVRIVDAVASHPSEHSHAGMNPVAYRLAANNGSQCGYCSVGFVMNMSEFIINHPNATKKEIEEAFDGNLCRCTGYRSILTGMKTFASDWDDEDEKERMPCDLDDVATSQLPTDVAIPFPKEPRIPVEPVVTRGDGQQWVTPTSLTELAEMMIAWRGTRFRLVHGNTSFGVYKDEYPATERFIDIRLIPELHHSGRIVGDDLIVSAGTTYNDFLNLLSEPMSVYQTTTLTALDFMARRTAGRIIRNAASLGGNTMLVLKHIASGTGPPFPSDLFTTLVAIDAKITLLVLESPGTSGVVTLSAGELVDIVSHDPSFAENIVLLSYALPLGGANDVVLAQKVALREVNAHSIVNATTRFSFSDNGRVANADLVFGGIAPYPWHARDVEAALRGEELTLERIGGLARMLAEEVRAQLQYWRGRMAEVPDEGFTEGYRTQLAVAFFYKAVVHALRARGVAVPPDIQSSGDVRWGKWPVSKGTQAYSKTQSFKAPVAQPYIKNTAVYQTSGQLHYTHELAVPPRTANGAFVQSKRALARFHFVIPDHGRVKVSSSALREHLRSYAPGAFIDLITHENFRHGGINLQGMGLDQPLFATGTVSYVGQAIAVVLATTEQEAIRLAKYVTGQCVAYAEPGAPWTGKWSTPIIDLLDAIAKESIFPDAPEAAPYVSHIWKITRPGSRFDWVTDDKDPLDREIAEPRCAMVGSAPCIVVESSQLNGGQAHFYMEPQACIALPVDEGRIVVRPSTQSPMAMHETTAKALGFQYHQVEIDVAPVGGGFGGKTEQTRFVTGATAVAAIATKRPVRIAMPRAEDTAMIGKRHAYYGQYQIAVDTGEVCAEDRGIIHGFQVKLWGDGGAFYDCSFIVSNCIQLRTDNAYRIKNFQSQIDVCRTNTAPSTAMRAFGDVQGKNIIENAIDDAAVALDMLPEELREKNFYDIGDVTPFGQALTYCYMKQVWDYVKHVSRFDEKRAAVDDFNRRNRWVKRGISIIPVKYGSGYNLAQLEQATAVVVVNQADGTIVIHQPGVEIGQGLTTQARQVAAYVLGLPMEMFYIDNVNTSVTPNPTSTGGSTGTPYAGEAVKQTCEQLRSRLMEFGYQLLKDYGDQWCRDHGVDFWNHTAGGGKGWATVVKLPDKREGMIWQFLVQIAYAQRVNLVTAFTAKIHGGEVQVPAMTFKTESDQPDIPGVERIKNAELGGNVDLFVGFTYSAACSVAEVDILTGEVKIISSDIVYDMGWSMNPALDIGQVEGAFVQGIGYLLTEKLVFEPGGENAGRLNTDNTWRYKIPAVTTIPLEMNTYLFPRDLASVAAIPEDPNDIFSAKEVGEPPLVLANSVFFAIKAAIRASRVERNLSALFRFDAPATVQDVRQACEVVEEHLGGE